MKKIRIKRFEKGVYILPNLLTTASVFCSFYAMVSIIDGKFYHAAVSIIIAIIFDGLDGRIARLTNSTSNFGLQLDSLADAVSFGVAPALLMYSYALNNYGRVGWLAAFLFVICGLLRLARFNIQEETDEKKRFTGLPIPGAAGFICINIIMTEDYFGYENVPNLLFLLMVYALAILMVSNVPFESFKGLKLTNRRTFHVFLVIILVLYLIAVIPQIFLFIFGSYYIFSSPLLWLYRKIKGLEDEKPVLTNDKDEP